MAMVLLTSPARAVAQAALAPAPAPVFASLLADPKEPQFFAAYLFAHSPRLAPRLGSVGFGQTIGLVGSADWQIAVAATVFSQFDMASRTTDLINTDYLIGLPVTYRHGPVATRFRLYHQSSHLGDQYLVHTHAERVTYSYEAAELLVSDEIANWRVYGGGEYLFMHTPDDLRPGVLHGGVEYRQRDVLVRLGRFGTGRVVAALDGRAVQDRSWQVGWSGVAGLEVTNPAAPQSGWRWSVLFRAYTGPSPYGQFYQNQVSSVGVGLGFML
ncbi:MAG TPA: DUF1207 domain-containing protein [Gemmatimonadales bacterium]|nr:DUF1207 domain-containing protein [Gemmatimonadales bacterium]